MHAFETLNIPMHHVGIHWFGQSSFAFKSSAGTIIQVDPYFPHEPFVELVPGTDGLVHISQLGEGHVEKVTDVLQEGDTVTVKVIGFDRRGKLKLSMLEKPA